MNRTARWQSAKTSGKWNWGMKPWLIKNNV